jgi:hypothetical protein
MYVYRECWLYSPMDLHTLAVKVASLCYVAYCACDMGYSKTRGLAGPGWSEIQGGGPWPAGCDGNPAQGQGGTKLSNSQFLGCATFSSAIIDAFLAACEPQEAS